MKKILLAVTIVLASCSAYYEEEVQAFTEQEIKDAEYIKANKALKEGTFHMQPVSNSSSVRVAEKIRLKKPNLPPYDVVYIQTDLEDILLELANSSGETVVIPQSVRGRKITLSHSGANFQEMLNIVLSKAGYSYNYIDGIWNITRYPIRNYVLEIGQSDRKGSLDTSEISSSSGSDSDSGDSGDSGSSSSSDDSGSGDSDSVTTEYEDKTWTEVDENIKKLITYGNFKTTRKSITATTNTEELTNDDSNLNNNFAIVDLDNKQETVAPRQTLKESEVVIDDDNIEPWYSLTKSAGMITVRAAPEAHRQIERYLEKVQDSLHRQIFVEVRIVGITEEKKTNRGIQFTIDGFLNGGFQPSQAISKTALSGGFLKVSNSSENLDGIIENLASINDLQLISTPQILVRNNQVGYVKIVNDLPYITTETETSSDSGVTLTTRTDTVNTKTVGTILSIMPYIGQNKVQLRLRLTVSQQSGSVKTISSTAGGDPVTNEVPSVSSNIIDQDMIVQYGRVYALGGYVEEKRDLDGSYVPGFNHLPGFSELMKSAHNTGSKTRFIIFVKVNKA